MKDILVVEDSRLLSDLISKRIEQDFPCRCLVRNTFAEAVALLDEQGGEFSLAVLDLNLPDAGDGEIVEQVVSRGIPTIVVTGLVDDEMRDRILKLQVFDYLMKGPHTLDLLSSSIRRYLRNSGITILIVDDSLLSRETTASLLATQYFNTVQAANGSEALRLLLQHPETRLLLTDYHMPGMNGFELISDVRTRHSMEHLAIIGLSARGNPLLSAQFLKRGANDFLSKPYFQEELIWRVNQNIEMLDHLRQRRSQQQHLERTIEEQTAKLSASQELVIQQEKLAVLGQLAAGVAHEINNPIGFIASNLNTLGKYLDKTDRYLAACDEALAGLPDGGTQLTALRRQLKIDLLREDLPQLLTDCLDGIERMRKIVLGLKGFARKDDAQRQLADINQCLEEAITIAWNELKYKAQLERNFADLPQTFCFPQQLSQVFVNLLVNAAHAIDKQGVISIVTRCNQEQIEVEIRDTGCGIPADKLEKIFEPFFTTKEPGRGTGLGMGIAREIVTRHEGKLGVESEIGIGTSVKLSLPVVAAVAAATVNG